MKIKLNIKRKIALQANLLNINWFVYSWFNYNIKTNEVKIK